MLNIYRASAGAGKTHHLTGEYIKLLFRKDLLPESAEHETQFKEILAVTFTNKSTAEMKARIVKELNTLSREPQESDYYDDLKEDGIGGTLSDIQIKEKAKGFLTDILNNYSDFAISTIDSFFQKIVRSFARELNLQCNYEVELNTNRILDAAVSNFMDKLDLPQHKKLFNWMLKFSEKKIEEGAGWRLEKDLQQLAKSVLTSEEYRTRREAIKIVSEKNQFLQSYTGRLLEIIQTTKKTIRTIGEDGIGILQEAGFSTSDFKGASKSKMKIFEHWQNGEIKELDEELTNWSIDDSLWYTKTQKGHLPSDQTIKIQELLKHVVDLTNSNFFINYFTAKAILDNIYQLGILADIDNEVNEYCNEEGSMLLSSTTEMLNKLINVDDAPFIYEKTGTHIHSFMIDEFQDTSSMQWNNFKPLIENSLADGRKNLIVGDVKQSIYRWRGSDWGLLHSGLKRFAIGQSKEDKTTLDTNYRSQREIIKFNNDFFTYTSKKLAELFTDPNIEDIYSDVIQKVPSKKKNDTPGAVDIKFFNVEKGENYEDLAMEYLPQAIIKLEDAGFRAKDIAILCRTKAQCKKVADSLLKYKSEHPEETKYVFDIISSEALLLSSRHVIRSIISILRYIQNPNSNILKSIASCNYLQLGNCSENDSVKKYFKGDCVIEKFLEFANRPLYDMLEGIISQLPSINKDIAFVQAFRDYVLEFTNNKKSDIAAFLEWWDQYGTDLCINTPEGQNAIRIMTIHKSKGLGMPAVILPFIEGTTDLTSRFGDIIWCKPEVAPFYEESLHLPIRCNSSLTKTIFAKDYQQERLKAIIDNLNTIYVAFTRAKEAMVIFSPNPGEKTKDDHQEVLLKGFLKEIHKTEEDECLLGEYGRKKSFEKDDEKDSETISQGSEEFKTQRKIPKLSLQHNRLIKDIDAIEKGNRIHDALSVIIDYENIDSPIENLYTTGKLDEQYFTCEEMKSEIHRLLQQEEVRDWFKPGSYVLNERTILARVPLNDGQEKMLHRPDRIVIDGKKAIVIDYKTGEQQKKHYRQVSEYMDFLSRMGFEKTEGYLWYTNPHQVVKVKNKGSNKSH